MLEFTEAVAWGRRRAVTKIDSCSHIWQPSSCVLPAWGGVGVGVGGARVLFCL